MKGELWDLVGDDVQLEQQVFRHRDIQTVDPDNIVLHSQTEEIQVTPQNKSRKTTLVVPDVTLHYANERVAQ